jgi:hypothetical protein
VGEANDMDTTTPQIVFNAQQPFYPIVSGFLASVVGLGPLFDHRNPLKLDQSQAAVFAGFLAPTVAIDMQQVISQTLGGGITSDQTLNGLCCMLANTAYETVKDHNDVSPEFEVLRHLRNAASHRNRFHFMRGEPKRPAKWRTFEIDHTRKNDQNPLHGTACFGTRFGPADLLLLLSEIECKLPK